MAVNLLTLAEFIQGDFKLSMWIPADLAGRVVGKKGVVITNLQRETHAKQMNALSPVGDSLWIAVVIIGDWRSISLAYKAVSDIVSGEVDDVVLEFSINYRKPFFLYKRGKLETLKHISAKTGVRIFLPENSREVGNIHNEPVTLEGPFDSVQSAVTLIESDAAMSERNEVVGKKVGELYLEKDEHPGQQSSQQENIADNDEEAARRVAKDLSLESKLSLRDKKATIERRIDVPLNLVGLLLSRKPQLKVSILNQIQGMTFTTISKILPPPEALRGKENKQEVIQDETVANLESQRDMEQKEIFPKLGEDDTDLKESEFVPFKIVGHYQENINMAYDHLQRIIQGERIKDIIEILKIATKGLPRPLHLKDKPVPRPKARNLRPE